MTKAGMANNELESAWWERTYFEDKLSRFNSEVIIALIDQLDVAITDTRDVLKFGLECSIYPGEDAGQPSPSRDPTSYVLDHLLANALAKQKGSKLRRVHRIRDLVLKLEPEELVALLGLYSEYRQSVEGISRAYDVLLNKMEPYRRLIHPFKHAASGGLAKRTSQSQAEIKNQHKQIKQRASELSEKGMARRDLASFLAKGFDLTPRHIRNVLKKAEPC